MCHDSRSTASVFGTSVGQFGLDVLGFSTQPAHPFGSQPQPNGWTTSGCWHPCVLPSLPHFPLSAARLGLGRRLAARPRLRVRAAAVASLASPLAVVCEGWPPAPLLRRAEPRRAQLLQCRPPTILPEPASIDAVFPHRRFRRRRICCLPRRLRLPRRRQRLFRPHTSCKLYSAAADDCPHWQCRLRLRVLHLKPGGTNFVPNAAIFLQRCQNTEPPGMTRLAPCFST